MVTVDGTLGERINLPSGAQVGNENATILADLPMQKMIEILESSEISREQIDFDVENYLNEIFKDEASLENVENFLDNVNDEIEEIDSKLSTFYTEMIASQDDHEQLYAELELELKSLTQSVEESIKFSAQSSEKVSGTLSEVQIYTNAKNNLEKSIQTLNNLIYIIEASKKLKILVKSQDLQQIAAILAGYEQIIESIGVLKDFDKIQDLIKSIDDMKGQLKDLITMRFQGFVNNIINCNLAELAPVCMCIKVLDPEFRDLVCRIYTNNFKTQLEALINSFNSPDSLESLNFCLEDLQEWLKLNLERLHVIYTKDIFPNEWKINVKAVEIFAEIFDEFLVKIYGSLKSIEKEDFRQTSLKLREIENLLQKHSSYLDDKNDSQNLYKNKFLNHNAHLFTHFCDANNKEFDTLMQSWKSEFDEVTFKKVKIYGAVEHIFKFFKAIIVFTQDFPNIDVHLKVFQMFARYLNTFFDAFFTNLLSFVKKSHQNLTKATNSESTQKPDGNFYDGFLKKLNISIPNSSPNSDPVAKKTEILTVLGSILASADHCFDMIGNLESYLRSCASIELIDQINFNREAGRFIEVINGCNNMFAAIVMNETGPSFQKFASKSWYADPNSNMDSTNSKYALSLITSFKSIISEVPQATDLCRNHFIKICKLVIQTTIDHLVMTLIDYHKGITMKSVQGPQILSDMRLISSFLSSLPVLNSNLTVTELPEDFKNFSSKSMRHLVTLFKFLLIDTEDASLVSLVGNFKKIVEGSVSKNLLTKILVFKGITLEKDLNTAIKMITD